MGHWCCFDWVGVVKLHPCLYVCGRTADAQAIKVSPAIDDAIAHGLSKCLTETDLGLGPCTVVTCSRRWLGFAANTLRTLLLFVHVLISIASIATHVPA